MNVLLINPLSQASQWENDIIAKQPPCGLLYIASYLIKSGHQVRLYERKFDLGFKQRTTTNLSQADKQLQKYLAEFRPDYVGISATTPQITDAYRCATLVKLYNQGIKIIFGGAHSSAEPEITLKECRAIDAVCIGEGEDVMREFIEGHPLKDIRGLSFPCGSDIVFSEKREFVQDLDKFPPPARELLDEDFYFSPSSTTVKGLLLRGTTVYTQRGCPYSCTFCQNNVTRSLNNGKYLRQHSIQYVEEEIRYLLNKYKIQAIFFDDPCFLVDKKRVLDLCNMLIRNRFNEKIVYEVSLRADNIDDEVLLALKESGCTNIIYGLESGSDKVLKRMNKQTTVDGGIESISLTKKYGISCVANFVLGTPGETEQDFLETLKFIRKTSPDWITRHKFHPLPGTAFYRELFSSGKLKFCVCWDDLYDKAVLGSKTFADIPEGRFNQLCVIMDRRLVLPTNYLFKFRMNIKRRPIYALRQLFLMLVHTWSLYLPAALSKRIRCAAEALRIKSRYVYE